MQEPMVGSILYETGYMKTKTICEILTGRSGEDGDPSEVVKVPSTADKYFTVNCGWYGRCVTKKFPVLYCFYVLKVDMEQDVSLI